MSILDRLKELTPHVYRMRVLAITAAIVVVAFLVNYLFYVRHQTVYFTDRSFRRLSLVGSQITAKVETAGVVLKNNSDKFINPANPKAGRKDFSAKNEKDNLKDFKALFTTLTDDGPEITPVSIRAETPSDKTSPGTVSLTALRNEGGSSWLYLDYVSDVISSKKVVRVQGKVDLNSLVQPFMSFSSSVGLEKGQFENLLISEADSARVIFQNDPTQLRLASLDQLSATDDSGKSIDLKEVGKTSSVADVALAGSDYKLFSQPIKFSLSSDNAYAPSTAWIVSGLIRADDFRSEVWSISYNKLILFGALAMLLVLSWPFFKLVLTGQKDRLRTADIYFLVFATIVGIAMLTSLAFYRYLYTSAEVELNKQLGVLAGNISGNFHKELGEALKQLDAFSNNCALLKKLGSKIKECKDPNEKAVYQHAAGKKTKQQAARDKADPYQQAVPEKMNVLSELLKSPKTTYPYFDTAVWLDDTGRQKAKWTIKSNTAKYINVSRRDYFKNIRLGHYYEINGTKFWLEPIVSRTTGRNEVEISKAAVDPNWIAAFDTQLISLMRPVLPESFGFAIVANDGNVLFHSDEARNLGENFFQECDNDPALRAEVIGRTGQSLNVRYLGEDHSVLVTTIPDFPDWSLLVFRNKQPLRGAFLELISLVSLLFLIYTILLLIGFSIFYLVNVNNERRVWLWPSKKKTEIYFQSFLMLLGLSVLSVALAIRLHGQYLVWVSALIGLVSALAFFAILFLGNTRFWPGFLQKIFHYPAKLANHHLLFVLNVTFLLVVIAILPAAAFFKYAYETQMKLFIKQAQFTFVDALAKRDERIRNQYANIKTVPEPDSKESSQPATPGPSEFTKDRLKVDWDIYDSFFYGTVRSPAAPHNETCIQDSPSEALANLTSYLPFPLRNSIRRQALSASTLGGGVCKWEAGADGKLVLHLDSSAAAEIERPWQHLISDVPQAKGPKLFWFAIFVFCFPVFVWFMYFILRKVFLFDVYKPTTSPLGKFLTTRIERNVFVVVDAPFTEKQTSPTSNICLKDMRTIVPAADGSYKLTDLPGRDHAIGLDNFDCNLNDPQSNVKKLDLLEDLLEEKRTLMIFSSVEPSQYQFKNGANGHENGGGDQDGRWAEIMSQFFTDYAEDTGDPEEFTKYVEQERTRILSLDLKGRSVKEVNELIDTVETECKRKAPLQHIGRQILAGDDFITLGSQHLLKRIVNQAKTYYTYLWNSCSISEKLTLSHLATDRLLNHRDPDIETLMRRELIVRDDDVHLMNDSFRQFVLSVDHVALKAEHEQTAESGSSWQSLRGPLLVVMIAFVVFLFVTQRDVYTSSLALITALTTLIPAFFKLLSLIQGDPVRRPPPQN
jgi:hypothetical protein